MADILVLGNGASRLAHDAMIREWSGEVWGCNSVYRDYGPILSRVATDSAAMLRELIAYRAEAGMAFEIWAWGAVARAGADKHFTSPARLRSNSGLMLAMQAVEEGYRPTLCGFDMGGDDVYLGDLGEKPNWLKKWRGIVRHYGPNAFRFVGQDWTAAQEGRVAMKVQFENGYTTEMRDEVAKIYIAKGKVKQVKEKAEAPKRSPGRPKKSEVSGVQRKPAVEPDHESADEADNE